MMMCLGVCTVDMSWVVSNDDVFVYLVVICSDDMCLVVCSEDVNSVVI